MTRKGLFMGFWGANKSRKKKSPITKDKVVTTNSSKSIESIDKKILPAPATKVDKKSIESIDTIEEREVKMSDTPEPKIDKTAEKVDEKPASVPAGADTAKPPEPKIDKSADVVFEIPDEALKLLIAAYQATMKRVGEMIGTAISKIDSSKAIQDIKHDITLIDATDKEQLARVMALEANQLVFQQQLSMMEMKLAGAVIHTEITFPGEKSEEKTEK